MTIRIFLAAAFTLTSAWAGGAGWSQNFAAAQKEAAAGQKDLLLDFTGSDWCSWCIKLNKEVFDHEAFKTGVKDSLVLVELDYPQDQAKLPAEVRQQNEALLKRYPVKGYPTILLCDPDGKPFAATGYQAGGPEKYVEHLNALRAHKSARDAAFAKAGEASGLDQARQLIAALDAMGLDDGLIQMSYQEIADKIKAADPKDETGYSKKSAGKQRLAAFMEKLGEFQKQQDSAGALAFVNQTLAEKDLPAEFNQHIHGHKAALMMYAQKPGEAMKVLEAGIAVAPGSAVAVELEKFLDFIRKQKDAPAAPAGTESK